MIERWSARCKHTSEGVVRDAGINSADMTSAGWYITGYGILRKRYEYRGLSKAAAKHCALIKRAMYPAANVTATQKDGEIWSCTVSVDTMSTEKWGPMTSQDPEHWYQRAQALAAGTYDDDDVTVDESWTASSHGCLEDVANEPFWADPSPFKVQTFYRSALGLQYSDDGGKTWLDDTRAQASTTNRIISSVSSRHPSGGARLFRMTYGDLASRWYYGQYNPVEDLWTGDTSQTVWAVHNQGDVLSVVTSAGEAVTSTSRWTADNAWQGLTMLNETDSGNFRNTIYSVTPDSNAIYLDVEDATGKCVIATKEVDYLPTSGIKMQGVGVGTSRVILSASYADGLVTDVSTGAGLKLQYSTDGGESWTDGGTFSRCAVSDEQRMIVYTYDGDFASGIMLFRVVTTDESISSDALRYPLFRKETNNG